MIGITRQQRRALNRKLEKENGTWPETMTDVPAEQWPEWRQRSSAPVRVLRSKNFLVQVYDHEGVTRLSVSRTSLRTDGRWDDSITWDELQQVKAECGYGDRWAIEIYPPDADVVNVSNLRHLWLTDAPPFAWRRT